jgi:hypothetical protein
VLTAFEALALAATCCPAGEPSARAVLVPTVVPTASPDAGSAIPHVPQKRAPTRRVRPHCGQLSLTDYLLGSVSPAAE